MTPEAKFQRHLIKEIKRVLPDAIVLKNDAGYIQGIPDLLVLNGPNWAALEVKKSENASHRPNQDYYVHRMKGMSHAWFVFPENEKEILNELHHALA